MTQTFQFMLGPHPPLHMYTVQLQLSDGTNTQLQNEGTKVRIRQKQRTPIICRQ